MRENAAAVIVTYHPDRKGVEALIDVLNRVNIDVVLVDNTPLKSSASFSGVKHQISLGDNLGIARAQNEGVRYCLSYGYDSIIFFDQDSCISADFIYILEQTFSDPDVHVVAPVFYDLEKNFAYKIIHIYPSGRRLTLSSDLIKEEMDVSTVISSGMWAKAAVFQKVGLFDERLFIDYVDTEWCLRCAAKQIFIRINPRAKMLHAIGDQNINFLGHRVPIHSPVRRYYRIRNAFLIARLPWVPKCLSFREIVFGLAHQLIIIISSETRMPYIKYYARAVKDGLCGVTGRVVEC